MNRTEVAKNLLKGELYSDEDFMTTSHILAYVMLTISLVGVVTNVLNIKIFISIGLDDGVTVSLFGLALSDLGFTFFGCSLSFSNILTVLEATHELKNLLPVDPESVFAVFSANIALMFYQITCLTTTFMAVARCMCVAMPFKFKDVFTRTASVIFLIIFTLIAMASYLPVLAHMGVQRKFHARVNATRFVLWVSSKRADVKDVASFLHLVVIVFVSSFVVSVCIIVMAKFLRQSTKFRNLSAKGGGGGDGKEATAIMEKPSSKLSGKELQVVKQVIVICIIYTLSMIPSMFLAVYRLMEEEFEFGRRLSNLYITMSDIIIILQLFNSASTFGVYYFYNSKFRSMSYNSSRPKK